MRRALRPLLGATADCSRLPGFIFGPWSFSSASRICKVSKTMSSHWAASSGVASVFASVRPSCSTASSMITSNTPISPVCITSSRTSLALLLTRLFRHSSDASSRQPTEPCPCQGSLAFCEPPMRVSRACLSRLAIGKTPPWLTTFCACSGFSTIFARIFSTPVASVTLLTLGSLRCLSMKSISTIAGRMLLRSGAGFIVLASIWTTDMASRLRRMRPGFGLPCPDCGTRRRLTALRPLFSSGAVDDMNGATCAKHRREIITSSGSTKLCAASFSSDTTVVAAPESSAPLHRVCTAERASVPSARQSTSRSRRAAIWRRGSGSALRAASRLRRAVVRTPLLNSALRNCSCWLANDSMWGNSMPNAPTVAIQVTGSSPLTMGTPPQSDPSASRHVSVTSLSL
mmetsp:Transcript_14038/g.52606  ORF Transcript_14038/g.52606 Transcript_14038/m.52606 type:complete len:401 (+) Transcript_14038:4403-5605(+)